MLICSPRMYAAGIDVFPFSCLVIHCLLSPIHISHTEAATSTPEGRDTHEARERGSEGGREGREGGKNAGQLAFQKKGGA